MSLGAAMDCRFVEIFGVGNREYIQHYVPTLRSRTDDSFLPWYIDHFRFAIHIIIIPGTLEDQYALIIYCYALT